MSVTRKLLVIGSVWPEPTSSAAGSHMLQILHFFREDQWNITYAATSQVSPYVPDLADLGMKAVPVFLNDASFDAFVCELNPDVVLFDRFMAEEQFGWRVAAQCPHALRIIETVDLHFLRKARKSLTDIGLKEFRSRNAARELSAMYRSDLSLMISYVEMELLQQYFQFPEFLMAQAPFMVPSVSDQHHFSFPWFSARNHFVTIGNFLHEPNFQSVKSLKDTIWPLIRKEIPNAELHIYGSYMPDALESWHDPQSGFYMMGRAEDALQTIQNYRVFLAPLSFGAGQKGKLLDAMLTATPSVTTSIGAESMHPGLAWNGFIEDIPENFVKAAVTLYLNETIWNEASSQSTIILQKVFDQNIYGPALMNRIYTLLENPEAHRIKNFTGFMLMQEFNYATKYMSRWIELKNQGLGS